jgi:hypothetical protein
LHWEEEDEVMALVLTFNNQRVAAAPTLFDIGINNGNGSLNTQIL